MNTQRGVAISGLLIWGVVIGLVAVLGMKVAPDYITYFKVVKAAKAVASNSSGKTVPEVRTAFDKYMNVEHVQSVTSADLDISKDGNGVVISFAYERRIPLFYNVSLLIDFQGSSSGN